jgi:hypothetical protein
MLTSLKGVFGISASGKVSCIEEGNYFKYEGRGKFFFTLHIIILILQCSCCVWTLNRIPISGKVFEPTIKPESAENETGTPLLELN